MRQRATVLSLLILLTPLLLFAGLTAWSGNVLLERIAMTLLINLTLVLGLQTYMGNSGILSFAHIGFMGIGAYASALFSIAPQMKAMALPELYPALQQMQWPFIAVLAVGVAWRR